MEVTNLTKDDFIARVGNFEADPKDWEYIGDKPCLVDFHAPWCGYCKRLNPLLDEMAQEFDGKIYIYKVDVDQEAELEAAFNIRTIPTLLLCPIGKPKEQLLGVMGKQELKKLIEDKLL
ncbi:MULTISPECIES: thioredoxin family protein [Parabacteroides]|uniref:thioredoxin family protein n=1 Tax=Parabacteroides provencensis TaxID=1944636 RepID=UPI000C15707F|nr:thioredoxin domain-containing protein [Parabacteroides provencensis]